jgi:hypothetical protein
MEAYFDSSPIWPWVVKCLEFEMNFNTLRWWPRKLLTHRYVHLVSFTE